MRVCDVNSSYSFTGGGIRVYHNRKLEYFSRDPEHTAALIVPGERTETFKRGSSAVHTISSPPFITRGYRMIVDSGALNSALLDFAPDIVEVGSPYLLPGMIRRILQGSIPTVGFYHTDFPHSYVRPYAERMFPAWVARRLVKLAEDHVRRCFRGMTAVFAASRCMMKKLRDMGVTNLFYTPLGVNTDLFSPALRSDSLRRSMGVPGNGILLLYLARLHWEKGLDQLMDAYPLFRDVDRIHLVIGGRGPHEELVREFIRRYPEVRRMPFTADRQKVAAAMASADVYLALGSYETFGLAALESISSGTVPVFPDRGAGGEMGRGLGLVPPYRNGDPESLARAVKLAAEIASPRTTERLRLHALAEYRWSDVFSRITDNYAQIIQARRAESPLKSCIR